MYLLAFSILLLCSALNLKAQESYGDPVLHEAERGARRALLLGSSAGALLDTGVRLESMVPVERSEPLLSEMEGRFFEAMRRALVQVDCQVMAKVNLDDVINTAKLNREMRSKLEKVRRKLESKHVDFVVCWGSSLNLLVIARIDPVPGMRPLQKLMQRRIDELLDSVGIPVVLFPPAEVYDEDEILSVLTPYLV
jgi:hypothetical protein